MGTIDTVKNSKVFCSAPWVSCSIQQNGDVLPCCYANQNAATVFGNLRTTKLAEVFSGEPARQIRANMLEGKESPLCVKCYALEKANYPSLRSEMNQLFADSVVLDKKIANGVVSPEVKIRSLEIRFSNVCNLKCRYCGVYSSSGWSEDHRHLGRPATQCAILTPTEDPEDLWREIEPLVPGLEWIRFTGGEPLISPQTYRLVEYLAQHRFFHPVLMFSTNFSVTSLNGVDMMDLWKRFDSVKIGASLDAEGVRGEYIRKNLSWEQAVANRKRLLRVCPKAFFLIAPVVSVLNALHLPDFHWDWVRRGYIAPDDIHLNILFQPEEYSIQILPARLKNQVAEKYEAHILKLLREYGELAGKAIEGFRGVVDYMMSRDGSELLDDFRSVTRRLDEIRGESFTSTFPELKELMEVSKPKKAAVPRGDMEAAVKEHFSGELSHQRRGIIQTGKSVIAASRSLSIQGDTSSLPYHRIDVGSSERSKVFCILPWTHLDVRVSGDVLVCHASPDAVLGSTRSSNLEVLWNSEKLRRMRSNMLSGKACSECEACYAREREGGRSTRQEYNVELDAFMPLTKSTRSDGSLERFIVPYAQIEYSNLCNFKCRYCHCSTSTAWSGDHRRLGGNFPHGVIQAPLSRQDWAVTIKKLLPGLSWLRFNGGEPLLSAGHYEDIKLLIKENRLDVRLSYMTNLSVTRYRDLDIAETWGLFHHVDIGTSLDGSGRRGEYIRKNQRWGKLLEHREHLFEACPRANFSVWALLSVMNVLHLPDFHREWIEKHYVAPEEFHITVLREPAEYSIQILPAPLKREVEEKYGRHIDYLEKEYGQRIRPVSEAFRTALNFMWQSDQSVLLKKFRTKTRELDGLWGERFEDVFPELSELMREA